MLQHARAALSWTVRPLVRFLDWMLGAHERDGRLSRASHALLIGFNAAIFACLFYFVDRPWVLHATFAVLLLQIAIIVSALLIISEETRYWDGLILEDQKILPAISCVRRAGLLTIASLALVFLAGLLCQHLDLHGAPIIKAHTQFSCASTTCEYLEYVLVCLHQMPLIGGIVQFALEQLDHDFQLAFASTPEAIGFRLGLYFATGTWIFGVFRLLMQQWVDVDALCQALESQDSQAMPDGKALTYLQMRAARAPGFMKRRMIRGAISHPVAIARRRYLTTCYYARILTFPQTFIFHLADQSEANKSWGLNRVKLLLEETHASLKPELRNGIISGACHQIKQGDHKPAIVADLWNIALLLIGDLAGGELSAARAKMLAVAVEPISAPNNYAAAQKRLLDLCSEAQIRALPQSFLFNIENHSDEVKIHGLQLVNRQIAQGAAVDVEAIHKSLTYALRDPENEAVKQELQALRRLVRRKEELDARLPA